MMEGGASDSDLASVTPEGREASLQRICSRHSAVMVRKYSGESSW